MPKLSPEIPPSCTTRLRTRAAALPPGIVAIPRTESVAELAALYAVADVVLNLSCEETFGLTTVEGFACGTPGIVLRATASPELGRRTRRRRRRSRRDRGDPFPRESRLFLRVPRPRPRLLQQAGTLGGLSRALRKRLTRAGTGGAAGLHERRRPRRAPQSKSESVPASRPKADGSGTTAPVVSTLKPESVMPLPGDFIAITSKLPL